MFSRNLDAILGEARFSTRGSAARVVRFAFVCVLLPLSLSACEERHHVRVRLTAVVERSGVQYSASGVQEYDCRPSKQVMNDLDSCKISGEALVIGSKGSDPLFMLLRSGPSREGLVWAVVGAVSKTPFSVNNADLPEEWRIAPEKWPTLVRFRTLVDPLSIQEVGGADASSQVLGDLKLVSLDVKKTDDPVTKGSVASVIPWITSNSNPFYAEVHSYNDQVAPFSQSISQYDFVSGAEK